MVSETTEKIKNLVETMLLSARIVSPRFEDYQIVSIENNADLEDIANELEANIGGDSTSQSDSKADPEIKKISDEQKQIKEDLTRLQGIINSPDGQLENKILDFISSNPFGRATLIFLPLVGAALTSPQIINKIIDLLLAPGGPFDKRLQIILEKQEEQFLSRLEQKRRQIGQDQVIISQFNGFGNLQGRLTTNTLNQIRSAGTASIGLNETGIGMH